LPPLVDALPVEACLWRNIWKGRMIYWKEGMAFGRYYVFARKGISRV